MKYCQCCHDQSVEESNRWSQAFVCQEEVEAKLEARIEQARELLELHRDSIKTCDRLFGNSSHNEEYRQVMRELVSVQEQIYAAINKLFGTDLTEYSET
jgi:hypothetical protein